MQILDNMQSFELSPELSQLVSFLITKNVCMVNYMIFLLLNVLDVEYLAQTNPNIYDSLLACPLQSNYYPEKD